jgi:isoleucyl-tRNA synthetase
MKKANTIYEEVGELDFPTLEKEILAFWQEQQIFDKLRQKNAGGPAFSFVDGPITANNPRGLGVHHAWGRTYKDAFQRYKAMCGFDQRFQNGFDCQGLWVEVEVEKELGLNGKGDILAYGL